ncbi:hypothetical protein C0992_012951, partial [Termitomyces sp. T32_za158]
DLTEYFENSLSGGRRTRTASNFITVLGQLVEIGSPATTVLTQLEANEASPADVFVYWHAFLQATSEILFDDTQEIPSDVWSEILGILNYRDCQVFVDGNLSDGADVYLAGAYLHPAYLDSNFFKVEDHQMRLDTSDSDLISVSYPSVFCRVIQFLLIVAQKEILHGKKPALTRWKGHATAFKDQFRAEMLKYGRREFPYHQGFTEQEGIMSWWRSLNDHEFGKILPVLALKIHAVRANSMAEERTVSTFTWITPALQNRLSVGSMVAMTKIKQFYTAKKQAQKDANPKPSASFQLVKQHDMTKKASDPIFDEEGDFWLDVPPDISERADKLEANKRGIVNMLSMSLKSILGGKQVVKRQIESSREWELGIEDVDDNDFTVTI